VILQRIWKVCGEELRKARRAIVVAYQVVRELDERALTFLLMFLGIR
jgi:hypothetical protein